MTSQIEICDEKSIIPHVAAKKYSNAPKKLLMQSHQMHLLPFMLRQPQLKTESAFAYTAIVFAMRKNTDATNAIIFFSVDIVGPRWNNPMVLPVMRPIDPIRFAMYPAGAVHLTYCFSNGHCLGKNIKSIFPPLRLGTLITSTMPA